jgi:hypothetical protein
LASVDDLYFAHLLNKRAADYGVQSSEKVQVQINDETRDRLLLNLNRTSLAFKDESDNGQNGLSVKSLRALNLLSSLGSKDREAD